MRRSLTFRLSHPAEPRLARREISTTESVIASSRLYVNLNEDILGGEKKKTASLFFFFFFYLRRHLNIHGLTGLCWWQLTDFLEITEGQKTSTQETYWQFSCSAAASRILLKGGPMATKVRPVLKSLNFKTRISFWTNLKSQHVMNEICEVFYFFIEKH